MTNAELRKALRGLLAASIKALALLDKQREEYNAALSVMPRTTTEMPATEGPIANKLRAAIADARKLT